jgi:hypothetical protein
LEGNFEGRAEVDAVPTRELERRKGKGPPLPNASAQAEIVEAPQIQGDESQLALERVAGEAFKVETMQVDVSSEVLVQGVEELSRLCKLVECSETGVDSVKPTFIEAFVALDRTRQSGSQAKMGSV